MTREELQTIIAFVEKGRGFSTQHLGITEPLWDIVLFVMRRHLENKLVTMTSLAQSSNFPYTTAVRKIDHMIEEGLIIKRARTVTGKSFSLHPSEELIARFHQYAFDMKELVAMTFGFPVDDEGRSNYYFGASYLAASIIPAPTVLRQGIGIDNTLRVLVNDDQTFLVWQRVIGDLEQWLGGHVDITMVNLDQLRERTLENANEELSNYDIVDFDLPWLGEYHQRNVLRPIDDLVARGDFNVSDFQPTGWEASSYEDVQYGVPIEPTPELLFYRRDILEGADIELPETTDDLLRALSELNKKCPDIRGISFCAAPGAPIAHMFMQIMGDFGRPPINLPLVNGDFDLSQIQGEQLRPCIDTPEGLAAADYLLRLKAFAPDDILEMDWDKTVRRFSDGDVAFAYAWSGRASRFDLNPGSPAYRNTGYMAHPNGANGPNISPMGGYALGIPANIAPDRVDLAWRVIKYLTSPAVTKFYMQKGCLVSPRFSVNADPEVRNMSRIIETVDNLAQQGRLKFWQRPPVPEFSDIVRVLGGEIHDMMRGNTSPANALSRAQSHIDQLMRAHNHY
ncbi:extracellular solute-binding protein [Salinisphaera hydrothermalis]|uniref:extracellular solute-binding protein n=1 Tax=Salinisphaera hydrothermalis TaxID=563188 RepID=UPI003341E299